MILLALILVAIVAIMLAEILAGDGDAFGTVIVIFMILLGLVCGMTFDMGEKRAASDYATGKITIEKTPVVTTIVE